MEKNIETDRLILRNFTLDDLDDLYDITKDQDTMHYSSTGPLSKKQTANLIKDFIKSYEKKTFEDFAIVCQKTNELIGFCGIKKRKISCNKESFLFYRLKKDFWGRKIAYEASKVVLDHSFTDLKLKEINALIKKENVASIKVAERLGMSFSHQVEYKERNLNFYTIKVGEFYDDRKA
jgi:RimJ/RimL family protein N-acetyltransferase